MAAVTAALGASNFHWEVDVKIAATMRGSVEVRRSSRFGGLSAPVQVASEVYSRHTRFAMVVYAATGRASLMMDDHGNNVVIA